MYVTLYVWICGYTLYVYKVMHHCQAFFEATGWWESLCQLVSFMSYRVERLAAGGPLRRVGDTLRSSASEPAGHPAGDAVPSVLLQHLRVRQKNAPVLQWRQRSAQLSPNVWKIIAGTNSALRAFIIYYHSLFATSFFLEASSRTELDFA